MHAGILLDKTVLNKNHRVLTRLESSTSCLMRGFTTCIRSQRGLLQGTEPLGRAYTLVPGTSAPSSSTRDLFAGGPPSEQLLLLLTTGTGGGTGIFKS